MVEMVADFANVSLSKRANLPLPQLRKIVPVDRKSNGSSYCSLMILSPRLTSRR